MAAFNPDTPCVIGCQWLPTRESVWNCAGDLQAAAAVLTSTATESIDTAWIGLVGVAGSQSSWALEVYDASDLPDGTTTTQSFYPGADVSAYSTDAYGWTGAALTTTNLYDLINDALAPSTYNGRTVPNDTWIAPIFGAGLEYACRFASISGAVTGQVVSVTLRAEVAELVDFYLVEGATFTPFLIVDGKRFTGNPTTVVGDKGAQVCEATWYANPSTGGPWLTGDIDDFDSATGASAAGWIVSATGSSNNLAVIMQGRLDVVALATEKRVAIGVLSKPTKQIGWHSMTVTGPSGSGSWSKATGTDYLFVFRRMTGTGFANWRYLTGDAPGTPAWELRSNPRLYRETRTLASAGDAVAGAPALMLEVAGGATQSVDSQPYLSMNDDGGPAAGFDHTWTVVDTTRILQQEVTAAADDYLGVRFLAAWEAGEPDADLLVRLKRRSDDVQFGDTMVVTPYDLQAPRTLFQVVETLLGAAGVTLTAVQFYLEWSSAATVGAGWRVQVLSTLISSEPGGPPSGAYDRTYGGTTDRAKVGATEYSSLDVPATIATEETAPTNVAAARVADDTCLDHIAVTWTATDVAGGGCGTFARYEIERYDTVGGEWERVAHVLDEATEAWTDYEARRTVESTYRIRVRRADEGVSAWVETSPVTRDPAGCCGFVFASNEAPSYSVWYDDDAGTAGRTVNYPANDSVQEMVGRDYAIGFGELEDRGDAFTIDVLVAADGGSGGTTAAATNGPAAFAPLRVLCGNRKVTGGRTKLALSYVAVLDSLGNRWLAAVTVGQGTWAAAGGDAHVAKVAVREVTDTPSTPDAIAGGS